MKYFDNGFYETQNDTNTRVEITDEYWQELLNQQAKGKEIKANENGYPIAVDHLTTNNEEYIALILWFNEYYTIHEQKYRRLYTLGNKEAYDDLIKLYNEAEIKRARIQELEALLGV